MSLLIKALKRAEHQNGKSNGSPGGLALEPLEDHGAHKDHNSPEARAASAYFAASAAPRNHRPSWLVPRNWSLIPATLVFAALFIIGYGCYVYLMTRPPMAVAAPSSALPPRQAPAVAAIPSAAVPSVATPGPAQETPKPIQEKVAKPDEAAQGAIPAPGKPATYEARALPAATPEKTPLVAMARSPDNTPNPLASSAYHALQEGRLDEAQAQYRKLAANEPRNQDALLGLAAIAAQKKQTDEAVRYYLQALEADPKNTAAQGGLFGLLGNADPLAAQSRLKQLLAAQPSAFLHFTLGNLYAEQGKWPAAEQAYFQAQQMEPDNADYAFNLAVSLEHLSQPAIALTYYRRAQQFSGRLGNVHFDPAVLAARINQLSGTPEEKR